MTIYSAISYENKIETSKNFDINASSIYFWYNLFIIYHNYYVFI